MTWKVTCRASLRLLRKGDFEGLRLRSRSRSLSESWPNKTVQVTFHVVHGPRTRRIPRTYYEATLGLPRHVSTMQHCHSWEDKARIANAEDLVLWLGCVQNNVQRTYVGTHIQDSMPKFRVTYWTCNIITIAYLSRLFLIAREKEYNNTCIF